MEELFEVLLPAMQQVECLEVGTNRSFWLHIITHLPGIFFSPNFTNTLISDNLKVKVLLFYIVSLDQTDCSTRQFQ